MDYSVFRPPVQGLICKQSGLHSNRSYTERLGQGQSMASHGLRQGGVVAGLPGVALADKQVCAGYIGHDTAALLAHLIPDVGCLGDLHFIDLRQFAHSDSSHVMYLLIVYIRKAAPSGTASLSFLGAKGPGHFFCIAQFAV